jgi:1-acyl-sn-glycerol-3-phosphate acyltransferase
MGFCPLAILFGGLAAAFVNAGEAVGALALVFVVCVSLAIVRSTWRSPLPFPVAFMRGWALLYLAVFKRLRVVHADHVPAEGPVILVANHTTAYDPVALQSACGHRLIRFMQAREYYDKKPLVYLYRYLQVIPVNRTGNDTTSFRTAMRALEANGCIGIFPEGQISTDGDIHTPRKGVALLALLSNATVVPAYFQGTRPFSGMILDFLRFDRVTIYFGEPIRIDDLAERRRNADARDLALKRIMDAVVALRDRYADGSR